jgi:hypothetical protein
LHELPAPIPHRLIGRDDAAGGHGFLDAPVTEAEAEVQPDTTTDDLFRKPMALRQVGW